MFSCFPSTYVIWLSVFLHGMYGIGNLELANEVIGLMEGGASIESRVCKCCLHKGATTVDSTAGMVILGVTHASKDFKN